MIDLEDHQERVDQIKQSLAETIEIDLDYWVITGEILKLLEQVAEKSVEGFLGGGGTLEPKDEIESTYEDFGEDDV